MDEGIEMRGEGRGDEGAESKEREPSGASGAG